MSNSRNTSKKTLLIILTVFVSILALAIAVTVLFNVTLQNYEEEVGSAAIFDGLSSTYGAYDRRFSTGIETWTFLSPGSGSMPFALCSKRLTGEFSLVIRGEDGATVGEWQGRDVELSEEITLERGRYTLEVAFTRYSGTLQFGLSGVQFLVTLPEERYRYVEADPVAGFHWDYVLYLPEELTSPYLLVIPNNTGYPDDDYAFHREYAKALAQSKRHFADSLGTPLLIPVFPRPAEELGEADTHSLDRNALLLDVDGYRRLDLQLLTMVTDARSKLEAEHIATDPRFLMWGFSASGTFADRFSLLHPDALKAVAAGASSHSLPFPEYAGENLPYPIGTYDYEMITGRPFDLQEFSSVPRFLFRGDQDMGGTVTTDTGVYPADEYFDLFVRPDVEAESQSLPVPLVETSQMTYREEDIIRYRIYQGAVFVDEFITVGKIFTKSNLVNSQFKLYEGAGHDYSDEMQADVLAFFQSIIG